MSSEITNLCKDCFELSKNKAPLLRCKKCGSPRIISHTELADLSIAHVDCDAFFASVEKRDNKDLASYPVIIGGGKRGVVSTCCYIARQSGVRSAMPTHIAKKLCPNAIFIKPNMEKYVNASRKIRILMEELTPVIEPLSIDEAFLDLSGTEKTHKLTPAQVLSKFAKKVEEEVGVSISIGLSYNKFLAKMASDLDKPRGFAIIGKKETLSFLAQKKVSSIYGVGKKFTQTLNKDGFFTIAQLQKQKEADLRVKYGEIGVRLFYLSRGIDERKISSETKVKSVSNEITFSSNISDFDQLSTKLLELCEKVSARLKAKNLNGTTIVLKLKTADFKLRTRSKHLQSPTQLAHVIYENAVLLLTKEIGKTSFRLIGVGTSGLQENMAEPNILDPSDLLDPQIANNAAAERAMDSLKNRFGKTSIIKGKLFSKKKTGEK